MCYHSDASPVITLNPRPNIRSGDKPACATCYSSSFISAGIWQTCRNCGSSFPLTPSDLPATVISGVYHMDDGQDVSLDWMMEQFARNITPHEIDPDQLFPH